MAVAFFLTPFIISHLGVAAYGVWSLANGVIGYLGLIDLGVRGSLGRFINQYLALDDDRAVNEVISTSFTFLTGSAVVVLFAGIALGVNFSAIFPKTPVELAAQTLFVLPVLAIGLWLAFIGAIYRNILTAYDRFDLINGIGLIGLIIRAALVVVLLRADTGILGLVAAVTISGAALCLMARVAAMRVHAAIAVRWQYVNAVRLREMWRFGFVAFATRGSSEIVYQSDQIILMAFLGPHAVAVYGVANMLILYAQRVVEQLGTVLNPALMKSGSLGDLPNLRKAYLLYPRAAFYVAIPLFIGYTVFGNDFIRLWVGPEFGDAKYILIILSIAELASLLSGLGGSLLFGLGRLRFNFYCSAGEAVLNVFVTIILVGQTNLGVIGAAFGTMISAMIFRGVAHPLYTTRAIGLTFSGYITTNGWRIVVATALALSWFNTVRLLVQPHGWFGFAGAVAMSGALFGLLGALIMFGRAESLHMIRAIPLGHRKSR
jgi:O-antigen/teichoic acid export membrane protein